MAEDSDLERTEPASPRRLAEARKKGNIPRSRELNTFVILIVAGLALLIMGSKLMTGFLELMHRGLSFSHTSLNAPDFMWNSLIQGVLDMLQLFMPFMLVLVVAALLAPIAIGGWLLSSESLQPDFARLNPLQGISRMFSVNSATELGKAIAKTLVLGTIGYIAIKHYLGEAMALSNESLEGGIYHTGHLLIWLFILMTSVLILIVVIDVPLQLWQYYRRLRMTKEEVKQEMKETEGDPHIKGRIRAMQREMARRRMMAEIPKADVIVTNPTHYAVALRYDQKEMRAPRVIAKGSYLLAERIREIGGEHNVPILSAPPLARALYKHADLDQEIPASLFAAVAEVLAYVYQLRSYNKEGGTKPKQPENIAVPEGMDILEATE